MKLVKLRFILKVALNGVINELGQREPCKCRSTDRTLTPGRMFTFPEADIGTVSTAISMQYTQANDTRTFVRNCAVPVCFLHTAGPGHSGAGATGEIRIK